MATEVREMATQASGKNIVPIFSMKLNKCVFENT